MTRTRVTSAAAILLLAGCSGQQEAEPTPTPETRDVTVTIADAIPLDAYFNLDDEACTARTVGMRDASLPQVTIEDGKGEILAAEEGPAEGGSFLAGIGCIVEVSLQGVPFAEVYTITVDADEGTWSQTIDDTEAGELEVTVEF